MKRSYYLFALIAGIVLLDQALKVWVKLHFSIGEEIYLFGSPLVRLHFVENPGMAFGWTLLGGEGGKLALSLFRLVAIAFLFWYLRQLLRARVATVYLIGFGLILAGALGNMLDSGLYGVLFSESTVGGPPARFVGFGPGYAPPLMGKVVDMFFLPVFSGSYPTWLPGIGGRPFLFFRPVFNLADVAISGGVLVLLWIYVRNWGQIPHADPTAQPAEQAEPSSGQRPAIELAPSPIPGESEIAERNGADNE